MKNYKIFKEDSSKFITGYTLSTKRTKIESNFCDNHYEDEKQIEIDFANKQKIEVPYHDKNEIKITQKMEKQAAHAISNKNKFLKNKKKIFVAMSVLLSFLIICGSMFTLSIITNSTAMTSVSLGLSTSIVFLSLAKTIQKNNLIKKGLEEIEKMEIILENETVFSKSIEYNKNMFVGIKDKTADKIDETITDQYVDGLSSIVNLSSMDNLTLKELKTLKENVERELSFDFDYSSGKKEKVAYLQQNNKLN